MAASKTSLQLQARILDRYIAFGASGSAAIEFFSRERITHFKRIRNFITFDYEFGERLKIQFVSPKVAADFLMMFVSDSSDSPTFVADVKRWMRVSYDLPREHEPTREHESTHEHDAEPASGTSDD